MTCIVTEIVRESLETTSDAAFSCDRNGIVSGWNDAATFLLGYSRDEVVGRPCCEVLRGADLFGNRYCLPLCPLLVMARRQQAIGHFEMEVCRRDGSRLPIAVSVIVVSNNDGSGRFQIVHLLGSRDRLKLPTPMSQAASSLTHREIEVVRQLAEGRDTREIAVELGVTISTVRKHVQNLMHKLGVKSRLSAVIAAMDQELL